MNHLDIALAINRDLSPATIAKLVDELGCSENIFGASVETIVRSAGIAPAKAESINNKEYTLLALKELEFLEKQGAKAVCATDEHYPENLKNGCSDHPHVLFYKGSLQDLGHNTLSVVGTRELSEYGQVSCRKIIEQIAELCPDTVIVSGLAYGIDSEAHRAALECGLRTVAVMANGIDQINPAANRALADKILEKGGALITEMWSQTKYHRGLHLLRNRIVAGITRGTLVVESPIDGGSMKTAEDAFGYDRAVMAVPGRINAPNSAGTNKLIKTNKAQLITCGMDVANYMEWQTNKIDKVQTSQHNLSPTQRDIMALLGADKVAEAQIAAHLGVRVSQLQMELFSLEMLGLIKLLSGGYYIKI